MMQCQLIRGTIRYIVLLNYVTPSCRLKFITASILKGKQLPRRVERQVKTETEQ